MTFWGAKEPGMMYFPILNEKLKNPRILQNHRVEINGFFSALLGDSFKHFFMFIPIWGFMMGGSTTN